MKAQDWLAVFVMSLVGLVCLAFAVEAVTVGEVICFGRGCARRISLAHEPKLFYFNLGGLLFLAVFLIGWSIRVFFKAKHAG